MMTDHVDFATTLERLAKGAKLYKQERPTVKAFSAPLNVLVKGSNDKYPNEAYNFAPFFNLPNLHAIYGWKLGENDNDDPIMFNSPFARLEPRSCAVEYIELRSSKLHRDYLSCILNATIPDKLKTFIYEVGYAWAWSAADHPSIMKILSAHHDRLEELCLSHEIFTRINQKWTSRSRMQCLSFLLPRSKDLKSRRCLSGATTSFRMTGDRRGLQHMRRCGKRCRGI
jgi:hypothetical protein